MKITYYINEEDAFSFKPETSAKLFKIILAWYKVFQIKTINDHNIKIEEVVFHRRKDNDIFTENAIVKISGIMYNSPFEFQMHLNLKDSFSRNPERPIIESLTELFVEHLNRIQKSINKQKTTIDDTLADLR